MNRLKRNRILRRLLLPAVNKRRYRAALAALESRSLPPILQIEPTAACNLQCIMCFRTKNRFPSDPMDFGLYERLIGQAVEHKVEKLRLYFRGEPLLHPRIADMVALARKSGIVNIELNTNGQLLTPEISEKLLNARLGTIFFSVEGYTKESYESIRRGASFERLLRNMEAFNAARARTRAATRSVLISVNMKANPLPNPAFDGFWRPYVDDILIVNMVSHEGIDRPELRRAGGSRLIKTPCIQLWDRIVVMADGTVPMCCIDMAGKHPVGDASEQPLEQIWKSAVLNNLHILHKMGNRATIPICASCTFMDPGSGAGAGPGA